MIITKEMQWRQEEHDRLFHHDIYCLSKINRIKHLVLHLAKYQGKYLVTQAKQDDVANRTVVIDAHIVLISLANVLNYAIRGQEEPHTPGRFSYNDVIIATANLCKITEAWDHMEPINFRAEYVEAIEKLLGLWGRVPVTSPVRWASILSRLEFVESKSFMYTEILKKFPHLSPGNNLD